MAKRIYDQFDSATGNFSAVALLLDGKAVGRVVIKYGASATAFVQVWGAEMAQGRASGGGYDKATAAVESAVAKLPAQSESVTANAVLPLVRDAFAGTTDGTRWTATLERAGFVLANVMGA